MASNDAAPEMARDRKMIRYNSALPVSSRRNASLTSAHSGIGHEQRLSILLPAELADPFLRLRLDEKAHEPGGLRPLGGRVLSRIDHVRVVNVPQLRVALHQWHQGELVLEGEVGSSVGQSVGLPLLGHQQ